MITAGHCVARSVNRPSQVRITLGEYVLKSSDEPLPGRTYGASDIKVHPYFKFTPQADRYDVAVIRLNRRVDMAPHISPLCLPPKGMDMTGVNGWASGWGALQPGSRLRPKTLQVRFWIVWSNFRKPKVQKLIDGAILKRTKERGKSSALPLKIVYARYTADASFTDCFVIAGCGRSNDWKSRMRTLAPG